MKTFAVALALLAQSATANPNQFDLLCEGFQKKPGARGENITMHLKVDLDVSEWCGGAVGYEICHRVKKIHEITATDYVFEDDRTGRWRDYTRLNRETGTLYHSNTIVGFFEGKCEKADFSGFPTANF